MGEIALHFKNLFFPPSSTVTGMEMGFQTLEILREEAAGWEVVVAISSSAPGRKMI